MLSVLGTSEITINCQGMSPEFASSVLRETNYGALTVLRGRHYVTRNRDKKRIKVSFSSDGITFGPDNRKDGQEFAEQVVKYLGEG